MNHGYGIETHARHAQTPLRPAARYLVVIESAGSVLARLFLDTRVQVAEFDASTEETGSMTHGLTPVQGAAGAEWDSALAGHSTTERAAATVYTLSV
ncbi:MAG: hypothetical protein RL260_903 [Pseudomonadota bacterium]|jgi:hypothetical protein